MLTSWSACTDDETSAPRTRGSVRRSGLRCGHYGWLLSAVLCPGLPAMAADLGGTVALSSQLIDRGIAITPRTPVMQGSVYWAPTTHWALNLSAAAETRSPGPLLASGATASRYWTLSDRWQAQAGLAYYRYRYSAGSSAWQVNRTEASLGWTYRETLTLSLSTFRNPGSGSGRIYGAADVNLRHSLSQHFTLSGGFGIAEISRFAYGENPDGYYRYGHAGLIWSRGNWSVELNRIATSANTPRPWGGPGVAPWVATASWVF